MALIALKTDPSRRDLVLFGCVWAPLFCGVLGVAVWDAGDGNSTAFAMWGVGAVVAFIGALRPRWIRPLFISGIYLTAPIGWVVTHAILAFLFYGVVTPIGLVLRLTGREPLKRRFEPQSDTYWVAANRDRDVEGYFRQF